MIGFTGRSGQKVTIPTKPTPTGFKIWVVASQGYFLHWFWHIPGSNYDFNGIRIPKTVSRKRKRDDEANEPISLTPTQSVVVALVKQLPPGIYHVYMDNLFSSPPLFNIIRQLNNGATGTARTNCGIVEAFQTAKKDDVRGKILRHTLHFGPGCKAYHQPEAATLWASLSV